MHQQTLIALLQRVTCHCGLGIAFLYPTIDAAVLGRVSVELVEIGIVSIIEGLLELECERLVCGSVYLPMHTYHCIVKSEGQRNAARLLNRPYLRIAEESSEYSDLRFPEVHFPDATYE